MANYTSRGDTHCLLWGPPFGSKARSSDFLMGVVLDLGLELGLRLGLGKDVYFRTSGPSNEHLLYVTC